MFSIICLFLFFGVVTCITHCPHNCNWNGHCRTTNGHCDCYEGFYNNDCSGDCGCNGHGICKQDHTCQCDEGWKWSDVAQECVWDCHCSHGVACIGPGICGCSTPCKYGSCWNGQCECWNGYTGSTCSDFHPEIMPNKDVNFGINLGGITYYSSEVKFVDIAKQSQSWVTERIEGSMAHQWDTHEQTTIHWRDDGYPSSLPDTIVIGKLMLRGFGHHLPGGNYTVLYDGEGDIDFGLVNKVTHYNGKGRKIVHLKHGSNGFMLKVLTTNPNNPIHNIRILLPGYEQRYKFFPFNEIFLEPLRRYSEIRFMDFLHTNGHTPEPTTWASRRLSSYHTQEGTNGGSIEDMIDICNILGANPWFNMPHAADDNYVTSFAQLVKQKLRPDLKVYVEYSNEVWNGIFRQTHYTQEQGTKLHLESHSWKAGMKYYNIRSTEIANLWKSVFSNNTDRIIPVWAWQTGYQDYTRQALADLGSKIHSFKAIAITGYISCNNIAGKHAALLLNMTMDGVASYCINDTYNIESNYKHYMEVAKNHSVKLLMYEGGPGIMENSAIAHGVSHDLVTQKAIEFNRDSHIEPVVDNALESWRKIVTNDINNNSPGGLFNYFSSTGTPSKYGSWGMLEYTGQDPATVPKYIAVQNYITKHFPKNQFGPGCSYVTNGGTSYGCYHSQSGTSNYTCGVTYNHGGTWWDMARHIPVTGLLVLDGYNPLTHLMFIRSVDNIAANTYFTIDTRSRSKWQSHTNWDYYSLLASKDVIRRLPDGVYPTSVSSCHQHH